MCGCQPLGCRCDFFLRDCCRPIRCDIDCCDDNFRRERERHLRALREIERRERCCERRERCCVRRVRRNRFCC